MLRSQMLSPIAPQSLAGLRQLADKMEKILLVALENYGNTFVEPKVELGARFGHLVCASLSLRFSLSSLCSSLSSLSHIPLLCLSRTCLLLRSLSIFPLCLSPRVVPWPRSSTHRPSL